MPEEEFVQSELKTTASAELQKEIEEELRQEDPAPEAAKAAIEDAKKE